MRPRMLVVLAAALVVAGVAAPFASARPIVLVQEEEGGGEFGEEGAEEGTEQNQRRDEERGERGAPEEQTGEGETAGPPWTYQMARVALLGLLLLGGAIGLAYYRFVVTRQRGHA